MPSSPPPELPTGDRRTGVTAAHTAHPEAAGLGPHGFPRQRQRSRVLSAGTG